MNKETLIQKWLDNELSEAEFKQLQQMEGFEEYQKIAETAKLFKAPAYDKTASYQAIQDKIAKEGQSSSDQTHWSKHLLKIAAVLLIGFSIYYAVPYQSVTEIETLAGTTKTSLLPDASTVQLNDGSTLAFNEGKWDEERLVQLNGEAYFEVAKGKKFTVKTPAGKVQVLGTKFNVKQRGQFLEVTCYEGLVSVTTAQTTIKLPAGETFRQYADEQIAQEKISSEKPSWLVGVSTFENTPFAEVVAEIERQYNIEIRLKKLTFDTDELFTGSFVHNDLQTALKSVSVPFNLTYTQQNGTVTLSESE